jgi:hypothetical protein
MKLFGQTFEKPHFDAVPIIRGEDVMYIICESVANMDDFDVKCPEPKPPMAMVPGGESSPDYTDKEFKKKMDARGLQKIHYLIVKSLARVEKLVDGQTVSEELGWELVDKDDPTTWSMWIEDIKAAGLTDFEISKIQSTVFEVNSLNNEKVEAARKSFLVTKAAVK